MAKNYPNGWDQHSEARKLQYENLFRYSVRWQGVRVSKFPGDLILYAHVIHERQPDFIVETGTGHGGSACFFADMLKLVGNGHVVTIDKKERGNPYRDNVTYLCGSSVDVKIVREVRSIVGDGSVMASLDSRHTFRHVLRELRYYSTIVTKGQYLVVEDLVDRLGRFDESKGPAPAVEWFLERIKNYRRVALDKHLSVAVTRKGWLLND
jgi:cephalosporin hydroxylase